MFKNSSSNTTSTGLTFETWTSFWNELSKDQQKEILRDWHEQDPINNDEIERTWKIAAYQQNKPNPFILDETLINRSFFVDDFKLNLHIQDTANITKKTGNIFLTNIHRVYDKTHNEPSFEDENTMNYFLGEKAVSDITESKINLSDIVRDLDEQITKKFSD